MKNFVERLNWRQVLIHLLACLFFVAAFAMFSHLFHIKTIEAIRAAEEEDIELFEKLQVSADEVISFNIWELGSGLIGLLIAFLISLFLSIKKGWLWLNSLLSFVFAIGLRRFDVWDPVKTVFYFPGRLSSDLRIEFLINGTLLLSIGLFLFFSKPINRFITGRPKTA